MQYENPRRWMCGWNILFAINNDIVDFTCIFRCIKLLQNLNNIVKL